MSEAYTGIWSCRSPWVSLPGKKNLSFPTSELCSYVSTDFPQKRKFMKWENLRCDGCEEPEALLLEIWWMITAQGSSAWGRRAQCYTGFIISLSETGALMLLSSLQCLYASICSFCGSGRAPLWSSSVLCLLALPECERSVWNLSGLLAGSGSWCKLSSTTPVNHAAHWSCFHAGNNLYRSGRKLFFVLVTDLWSAFGQGIFFFFFPQAENSCGYIRAV